MINHHNIIWEGCFDVQEDFSSIFYKLFFLKTGSCIFAKNKQTESSRGRRLLEKLQTHKVEWVRNLAPHLSSSFCFMWFLVSLLKINL